MHNHSNLCEQANAVALSPLSISLSEQKSCIARHYRGDIEGRGAAGEAELEEASGEPGEGGPVDFDGGRGEILSRARPLPQEVMPEQLQPYEK